MSFIETPRFPDDLSYGATGGPTYATDVVVTEGGQEYRNAIWSQARARYNVAHAARTPTQYATLLAYFRAMRGRAHGFRFKDWTDYACSSSAGVLGAGVGTAVAAYQLGKKYATGSLTETRTIRKPVSGTVIVYRNGSPATAGAGAGQYALDTTTGTVTWVADGNGGITAITVGATTVLTLTTAVTGAAIGDELYVTGVGGTTGDLLNGSVWAITNIATNVYTIAANTTGLTGAATGNVYLYPQPEDTLTWAGEFDVPVRFDADNIDGEIVSRSGASLIVGWSDIPLVELRT